MRSLVTSVAGAVLGLASPAYSQMQAPSPAAPAPQSRSAPEIKLVFVAELESLPSEVRRQVDAAVSRTSEEELQMLRHAIDAIPEASAALKARGKSASEVVAAALDNDGALVLITTSTV